MYIALKPFKADKRYMVGDSVPDSVIDQRAVNRLKLSGYIAETEGDYPPPSTSSEERKPVIPDKTTIEAPEPVEEPEQETPEAPEKASQVLSQSKMEKMNRQQLVEYAEQEDVEVTDEMVKREIIEAIMAKRGE